MSNFGKKWKYTITVIPDTVCDDIRYTVNLRFMFILFIVLITIFFTCFFFIIGYHVKLIQETDYLNAVDILQKQKSKVKKSEKVIIGLSKRLEKIQKSDRLLRSYANIFVPDDEMYKAGIGGHQLVDNTNFSVLNKDLQVKLKNLNFNIIKIDRQLFVLKNSLATVHSSLQKYKDIIYNTPTILPTYSRKITSGFGMRKNPITGRREFHDAVDFSGKVGDKVYATAEGIVINTTYNKVRGNYIELEHKYGFITLYAHLNEIIVEEGQMVKKGKLIGTIGRTGRTTGANLHYAVTKNNLKVNPCNYFKLYYDRLYYPE